MHACTTTCVELRGAVTSGTQCIHAQPPMRKNSSCQRTLTNRFHIAASKGEIRCSNAAEADAVEVNAQHTQQRWLGLFRTENHCDGENQKEFPRCARIGWDSIPARHHHHHHRHRVTAAFIVFRLLDSVHSCWILMGCSFHG